MAALIVAALAGLALCRPALAVYRLARMGRQARRHYPAMLWHAWRWRWLACNAGLAYVDRHHRRLLRPRVPLTTAVRVDPAARHLLRWPRARFRPDAYGWTATVRTIPRVGRLELADAAQWVADAWGCHRVTVTQAHPGRVCVRGLRTDPLAVPYGPAACPPGTFDSPAFSPRLLVGRDEAGAWRHLPLPGITGITVTGLPGSGKSTALASWLMQLAGGPVRFLILDGKGSQEWQPWEDRATITGDDLEAAEDALLAEAAEMRRRHARVRDITGHVNGWKAGPSEALPLRVVVLDECDYFLNATAHKGDRDAEDRARRLAQLVSSLIRRGRSVLTLVILATQTGLAEAFGNSQVRNNCALSAAFAVRTRDAAVAALGDGIRDWPDVCPTTHQGPESIGVCTTTLRTGLAAFTRIRCPEVSEEAAAARAAATASQPAPVRQLPVPGQPLADAQRVPV